MRISDWSSDVCSSDLDLRDLHIALRAGGCDGERPSAKHDIFSIEKGDGRVASAHHQIGKLADVTLTPGRSEEHTSELQSLMRISYAVFCLKKKKHTH